MLATTCRCASCGESYDVERPETDRCTHCLLTPRQQAANALFTGPQTHTLMVGGARSGKTWLITRAIVLRAARAPGSRHLMARLRFNHIRSSVWLDTLPSVVRTCFPGLTMVDKRADSYVLLPDYGSEIWFGGLDEKERTEKILGNEYVSIFLNEVSQIPYQTALLVRTRLAQRVRTSDGWLKQRAYYDLNPVSRRHWSNREFIEHHSPLTGRPVDDPVRFAHFYLNPADNIANLSAETLAEYDALPDRQRQRFFLGQYAADDANQLWTYESIEHARCGEDEVPESLRQVVVAIDPSGTAGDEDARSDEVGIIVAGIDDDGFAYVLDDLTCSLPPEGWARVAVSAFHKYRADRIIAEVNYGGDMVRGCLHAVDRNVPYREMRATRGKVIRAEPISAFYGFERNGVWRGDRVRHAGDFLRLESEMMDFTAAGYTGAKSPNRVDALVWALTDLMVEEPAPALYSTPIAM